MSVLNFSFEVFPPKTEKSLDKLWETLDQYQEMAPRFISVTYGAGGSTRDFTRKICVDIRKRYPDIPVAAHLTCVNASRDEINVIAKEYWDHGIKHIVALRGDPPGGNPADDYFPHPDGYAYAVDLVEGLKKIADFEISVAAYPEGHLQAPSLSYDFDYLVRKLDAGADRAISQFFFDPEVFLAYRDRLVKRGVDPDKIVPGLLPILNFGKMTEFAGKCNTDVPPFLHKMFEGVDVDSRDHRLLAMNVLSHQITRLITEGVKDFHFYTLNDVLLTRHLCKWLRCAF